MYISQCIIAKNEEENIGYCLSHLKSVVDEQIVVDTGSTDRTVEIAKELGAKVFHFEWINDFSAARNFALSKATGDWIIFLDCDEYFADDSIPLIKNYIKKIHGNRNINGIITELINIDKNMKVLSTSKNISPRIFRNRKNIKYKNKIHEYLVYTKNKSNNPLSCLNLSDNLKVFHTGYDEKTIKEKGKSEKYILLLKEMLTDNPEDSQLNLYISKTLYVNGEYKEALDYSLQALKYIDNDKDLMHYPEIFSIILYSMNSIEATYDEAFKIFKQAVQKYPNYPDLYMAMGFIAFKNNNIDKAIDLLEQCIYYCNNYNSNVESMAIGQIDRVYSALLNAYIISDNRPKIVEISVVLLRSNKHNYENLTVLIKTLLTQENEEDIIRFLSKIYDYNNFKDKIYLLKASESCKNEFLINYYIKLMSEEELNAYYSLDK